MAAVRRAFWVLIIGNQFRPRQRLAVRGAINEDLAAIRQAIKLDPLTAAACGLEEIDAMIDELLAANAACLPDGIVAEGPA